MKKFITRLFVLISILIAALYLTDTDYLNYEDPEWTKDDMRWTQEEKEVKVETV